MVALEIPDQFLKTLADPAKSLAEKKLRKPDGSDAMPDEATLAPQYQRTALAFYLQQEWSPAERLRYFATSSHAEGMKATAATYQSHEGGVAFADQAIARKSPSCLRPLVLAMLDVYPGAGQREFDRLQPRQFGEFLTTGRVDRWEVALAGQPAVRQDLMLRVIEDMAKVYPNRSAWERRLKDLSDTDFGEFLLYGRVRSWEDRELMART